MWQNHSSNTVIMEFTVDFHASDFCALNSISIKNNSCNNLKSFNIDHVGNQHVVVFPRILPSSSIHTRSVPYVSLLPSGGYSNQMTLWQKREKNRPIVLTDTEDFIVVSKSKAQTNEAYNNISYLEDVVLSPRLYRRVQNATAVTIFSCRLWALSLL